MTGTGTEATRADTIDVERDRGLTIVFGDGRSCFFANDDLRRNCPCATCRELRSSGEEAWPRGDAPAEAKVVEAALVGNWGISFDWNDGHGTGIFPFESLRHWCDDERAADGEPGDRPGRV